MADDDLIISIIGPVSAVDQLRHELQIAGVEATSSEDPPSGQPGTLNIEIDEPLVGLTAQFGAYATPDVALALATAAASTNLFLINPRTDTWSVVNRGAHSAEVGRLIGDDPVNLS